MNQHRPQPLRRSRTERSIAGVLGGLAKQFDLDPTGVRIAYVILSLISAAFPGILVYILLYFAIPLEEERYESEESPPMFR